MYAKSSLRLFIEVLMTLMWMTLAQTKHVLDQLFIERLNDFFLFILAVSEVIDDLAMGRGRAQIIDFLLDYIGLHRNKLVLFEFLYLL